MLDLPSFSQMLWVDWVILAVCVYFMLSGWHNGFIALFSSFIAYMGAVWVSTKYSVAASAFMTQKFGIPSVWANIIGIFIIFMLIHLCVSWILSHLLTKLAAKFMKSKLDNVLGVFIGLINGMILTSVILILVMLFPFRGSVKADIKNSFFGSRLVSVLELYAAPIKTIMDDIASETMKFFTINPGSKDAIAFTFKVSDADIKDDPNAERAMLDLVNAERIKKGVVPLSADETLKQIARTRSREMLLRGYFSHFNPDGTDVSAYLDKYRVDYTAVGENLAFAPTTEVALAGLLKSQSHLRNIMDPSFSHIGVGVIDAGLYGKLFTQVFITKPYVVKGQ